MANSRWRQNRNCIPEDSRKSYPRWNNPPQIPHSSRFGPNSVPSWEMQFCAEVGSVSWWKVVNARSSMSSNKNILEWDDTAVEEAFHNAKRRFWAHINGMPCDITLPDPDIYIDNVDFDAHIDPELVQDLERAYVAHDEDVNSRARKGRNKYYNNKKSEHFSRGCDKNQDNFVDQREGNCVTGSNDNRGDCRNQWDTLDNNSRKPDDNPWERSCAQSNADITGSAWGDLGGKSWSKNQREDNFKQLHNINNADSAWEKGYQGATDVKLIGWEDSKDKSWRAWGNWGNWDSHNNEVRKWDTVDNPWGHNTRSEASGHSGWKEMGSTAYDWKRCNNYYNEPKDLKFRKTGEGWGAKMGGCKKREDSRPYVSDYKRSRFQGYDPRRGNDHQTSNYHKKGRTN